MLLSDNPSTVYRAKEMMRLLETVGRIEKFDFRLLIRTIDRVEIMQTEKLPVVFKSDIQITIK